MLSAPPEMAIIVDFGGGRKFNPRNISHMPAAKISSRLELDDNISFLEGHLIRMGTKYNGGLESPPFC
jgi:hypothetical protein